MNVFIEICDYNNPYEIYSNYSCTIAACRHAAQITSRWILSLFRCRHTQAL